MGSPEPLCARCNERKDAGVHDTAETCEAVRGPCLDPARHHPYAAAPSPVTGEAAPNDGPLDSETTEGQPIESGGWWTPYTETSWGYFRFAIRPVEQPDGFLMFWHDADGAHTTAVILDPPDAAEPVEGAATASTGLEELRAADGVDLRLVVRVTAAEMATWAPERTSRFFAGIAMAKDAAGRRALAADGTEK